MISVVIMAGGRGERFWPKSRSGKPKQFTNLTGEGSLLYLTYKRVSDMVNPERVYVVTGREYKDITRQSVPDIPEENIIIEPEGRNTAPCIGLAAVVIEERFPGSTMIVLPADHLVKEEDKFVECLKTAVEVAESGSGLVTLGIKPTRPETGYGYLKTGQAVPAARSGNVYQVERFVEKPDLERAAQYINDGGYLWNGGIFIWKVPVILEAFKQYLPEIYVGLMEIKQYLNTDRYIEVLSEVYPTLPKISIDYGVMEKADRVFTVPGDFYWDDVGTWNALERVFGTDQDGNLLRGSVVAVGTKNTIVDGGERLVALVGVEDLVVVDTEDTTFVCHKSKIEQVRELLSKLRNQDMDKYL